MSGLVTVYAVFASGEEAERVARALVADGLAACANILGPCRSIFRWEGRLEETEEVPVLFKAAETNAARLVEEIAARHSYEVPAVTVWKIDRALDAYTRWVHLAQKGGG
ncbi:MAG: divalent-cation tolerance protein CutA [Sphingomonadaceae bacterium]|uniref:divalent-cation tolerance protein CutA n=1 Tax=Thermaurantiacus sp. TaxID=2820283 RepID=UPI00298F3A2F|nr:divalent-cation tolerance protein CutA [Thermaurantiacus sp.]MCS6985956.1 divalent-cation tolerance protein CutA [Sphingomonadaceae bacterium]MDW8414828.1 divalent-cation tolerance protein CutA [Thermaurantiacus sp.]